MMVIRVCNELWLGCNFIIKTVSSKDIYVNEDLWVSNVMVCYYLISNVVAWKLIRGDETPLE